MDNALALEVSVIGKDRYRNEIIEKGDSSIQKFYGDAVIFITGGSGFLGKQLIYKLFRSCKIKKIYLLLRPKKSDTIEERLGKMLRDPLYDELHKKQQNFVDKIIPVDGDVTKDRLGLSDEMWNTLTVEVDVIIHGAATVSFVENIKAATMINVKGTIEMLKLGKACKRLKSYVHISTAYSHAIRSRIDKEVLEKFYESPLAPTTLIDLVERLDDEKLTLITPKLIDCWPNTYTFTKAVAEEAVRTMSGDLPICIVRPAVVICSYREPPGWIDKGSLFGASGVVLGFALGILHVLYTNSDTKVSIVSVDMVNNAVIVAGWRTATTRCEIPKIYTVSDVRNPTTMGFIYDTLSDSGRQLTTDCTVWYGGGIYTPSKFLYFLLTWIFHYIPAYLVDVILSILGHKLSLVRIYKKANQTNLVLGYFLTNSWNFLDTNLQELYGSLFPADQVIYTCDTALVDRKEQIKLWLIGIRKYIIQDGLKNTEWGIKKQFYLKIANYIIVPLYLLLLLKIGFTVLSMVFTIFYTCYSFTDSTYISNEV